MRLLNKASIVFLLIDNYNKAPLNSCIITCNGKNVEYAKKRGGYYVFLNLEAQHYDFDISCDGFMTEHYSLDLDENQDVVKVVIPMNYRLDNMSLYNTNKIIFDLKDNGKVLANADVKVRLCNKVPFLRVIGPIKKGTKLIKINSDFNSKLMLQEYYYSKSPDFLIRFTSYNRKELAYENEICAEKDIAPDGLLYPVWHFKTNEKGSFVLPISSVFISKEECEFVLTVNDKDIEIKAKTNTTEHMNIDISK